MSWASKSWRKAKRWLKKPSMNQVYREARNLRDELEDVLGGSINSRIKGHLANLELLLKEH